MLVLKRTVSTRYTANRSFEETINTFQDCKKIKKINKNIKKRSLEINKYLKHRNKKDSI